jgi:hypothetical protein
MTYVLGSSSGESPYKLTRGVRHLEQAFRVNRPPSALSQLRRLKLHACYSRAAFEGSASHSLKRATLSRPALLRSPRRLIMLCVKTTTQTLRYELGYIVGIPFGL